MDTVNEINSGKGYAIVEIENLENFIQLRKKFIKNLNINSNEDEDIDIVREKIAKMNKSEINKAMVNLLKFNNLSEIIVNSFPKLIKQLCGEELLIQRRATVIMNVPGKGQAKQWPHYELMSGISPFTYVIWIPMHDLEENSGVYFVELKKSLELIKKEEAQGLVNGPTVLNMMSNKKPEPLKFGEAIIFNPFVLHGNIQFKSNLARIAYNVRFQSIKKPILQKNTDYLKYFKLN